MRDEQGGAAAVYMIRAACPGRDDPAGRESSSIRATRDPLRQKVIENGVLRSECPCARGPRGWPAYDQPARGALRSAASYPGWIEVTASSARLAPQDGVQILSVVGSKTKKKDSEMVWL